MHFKGVLINRPEKKLVVLLINQKDYNIAHHFDIRHTIYDTRNTKFNPVILSKKSCAISV